MKKAKLNLIIGILMLMFFILCALTGIIKLPIFLNYLDLFEHIPYELVSMIHDYSGIVLILLIVIHLVLHKNFLSNIIKTIRKRKPGTKSNYDFKRPL